ncbi:hypothetical protein Fmac_031062 [Flemingia macrophylla]|uniref:C2H2-type domain-containing protein n=1 Tax=Flemingia macrophylla TaxID=520843 RepID=A0ABD1L123_9FABA
MHMKRERIILKSHLEAELAEDDKKKNYSWQEETEDAARIFAGSMWSPRSYSCTFCKREFRSAQALGGHMNIHRRDRARLKQNPTPGNNFHEPLHSINGFKSLLGSHHLYAASEISTQIDCGLGSYHSSPATTITTTRQENYGQHNCSPYCCSPSVVLGEKNILWYKFNGLGSDNYVETSLPVGLTSPLFGQKSSPTGDTASIISCKRCSKSYDKCLAFQPSEEIPLGLTHEMEDLDLELRLGKQQKVDQ